MVNQAKASGNEMIGDPLRKSKSRVKEAFVWSTICTNFASMAAVLFQSTGKVLLP